MKKFHSLFAIAAILSMSVACNYNLADESKITDSRTVYSNAESVVGSRVQKIIARGVAFC